MWAFFAIALIAATHFDFAACQRYSPIVTTLTGQMRGSLVTLSSAKQNLYQFIGIPYAEPPMRFKKPVAKKPWQGVLNLITPHNACIQFDGGKESQDFLPGVRESENCLFLNLWVPRRVIDNSTRTTKLPVFVFFHGGAFIGGTPMTEYFNGTILSGTQDIIVATVQYRLGSLAFAYFGPSQDTNMGLWDQLEAIKWISSNIRSFGGDPNKITLAGESAGAASVTFHLLSPHSRQYVHGAIVQSGSAIANWATNLHQEAVDATNALYDKLCSRNNRTIACLQAVSVPGRLSVDGYDFAPVVDGDFLPRSPVQMLLDGDFARVPLLIGANKDEYSMYFADDRRIMRLINDKATVWNLQTYNQLMEMGLALADENDQFDAAFTNAIEKHYQPTVLSKENIIAAALEAPGDFTLNCPTYLWANVTADKQSAANNVFVYRFEQELGPIADDDDPEWLGAFHALEIAYVFGEPFMQGVNYYPKNQKQFSQAMMEYWGDFVKNGNPGQFSLKQGTSCALWPAFRQSSCQQSFYQLSTEKQVSCETHDVLCNHKAADCKFWQDQIFL